MRHIELKLSFSSLNIDIIRAGEDFSVTFYGGQKSHIGCTVLAVPRPSLNDPSVTSCTISVINVTGHKDEEVAKSIARRLSVKYNCTVSCSGGFHFDNIKSGQIAELLNKIEELEL